MHGPSRQRTLSMITADSEVRNPGPTGGPATEGHGHGTDLPAGDTGLRRASPAGHRRARRRLDSDDGGACTCLPARGGVRVRLSQSDASAGPAESVPLSSRSGLRVSCPAAGPARVGPSNSMACNLHAHAVAAACGHTHTAHVERRRAPPAARHGQALGPRSWGWLVPLSASHLRPPGPKRSGAHARLLP